MSWFRCTARGCALQVAGLVALLAACEPLLPEADAMIPAPLDAGACGEWPRTVREMEHRIQSAGRERSFLSYVPSALTARQPAPLVLVFHGANMSAQSMRDLTGFEQLADEKGFALLFGNGDPALTWNIRPADTQVCGIGELFTNPDADDFQFVDDMLRELARSQCLDRAHVFATGFSMGGYFSNHLACQRPELLRAAAPHSSGTYPGPCKGKVPMLLLNGTGDPVVDVECARATRDSWVVRNGCAPGFAREPIRGGHCERHEGCPQHAQVTQCLFDDMCHAWAGRGSGELLCVWDFGSGPSYQDATTLIWRFFESNW